MQNNIVHDWLNKRHITDKVIADFGLVNGDHPTLGFCIIIPVHDDQGQVIFNKYRRSPLEETGTKYLYDAGAKITLYGYWRAKKEPAILITEGELDSLVAWSANIPAISSTGGALSFQAEWVELLKDKEITLCFDNDAAGGSGMVKVLDLLPQAYVMFLPDRPGIKDITDYVASGGNLNELIKTRVRFTSLQDVIDHRSKRLSVWQSTHFHDAYIKTHQVPHYAERQQRYDDRDNLIAKARSYPIRKLLDFPQQGQKTLCPFHSENTPSFHYYPKTNSCYCFGGCGRSYDAIDIYQKLRNCSFKQAIKDLA